MINVKNLIDDLIEGLLSVEKGKDDLKTLDKIGKLLPLIQGEEKTSKSIDEKKLQEINESTYSDERADLPDVLEYIDKNFGAHNNTTLNNVKKNADACVLIVRTKDIKDWGEENAGEKVVIESEDLKNRIFYVEGEGHKLCPNTLFSNQRSAYSLGTGFFIAPQKILTAAHVLFPPFYPIDNYSNEIRLIRKCQVTKKNEREHVFTANKADIFKPTKTILEDYHLSSFGQDWAIIDVEPAYDFGNPTPNLLLDKDCVDIYSGPLLSKGQAVYGCGHGLGLPLKISYNGKIKNVGMDQPYFKCDLDFFSGNSGSPVFDVATHAVVGLLCRGESSFVLNNGCLEPFVFSNDYQGEECQKISSVFISNLP